MASKYLYFLFVCSVTFPRPCFGAKPVRKLNLRLKLLSCQFLKPAPGEILIDSTYDIFVDGIFADGPSPFYLDNPNPTPNWESDYLQNLTVDSVVELKVFDYDKDGQIKIPTETVQIPLPQSALSWNVSEFGQQHKFGNPSTYEMMTSTGFQSTGECNIALQVHAEECKTGEYATSSFCAPCPEGSRCSDGVTMVDCSLGTFSKSEGNTVCTPCSKGTSQSQEGMSTCIECPVGEHQDNEGQSICLKCASGTFANDTGSEECIPCEVGTSQPSEGLDVCVPCKKGEYQDKTGQPGCLRCDRGTFANTTGSEECTPCKAGTFQLFLGQDFCSRCDRGEYQDETGKSGCKLCPAGTFGTTKGSNTPTCDGMCPPGYFCPIGTADAFVNECGKNFVEGQGPYCPEGSEIPLSCPKGYYTTGATARTQSAIVLCEPGYACPGNGEKTKCEVQLQQYADIPGQSECIGCGDCAVNQYRSGCSNTSVGVCLACQINQTNHEDICGSEYDYEACKGDTISDVSRCKKPQTGGVSIGVLASITAVCVLPISTLVWFGVRHRRKLKRKLKNERSRNANEQDLNASLSVNVNPMLGQHVKGIDDTDNQRLVQELDDHNKKLQDEVRRLKKEEQEKSVLSATEVQPRRKKDLRKEFEVNLDI